MDVEENAYYSSWEAPSNTTLTRGVDFDEVVLGIPVSALPYVSGELSRASPRWKRMLDGSGSVATQALQLWVSSSLRDLGYRGPPTLEPDPERRLPYRICASILHVERYAHLLPAEGWDNESSVPTPPKSLAYFIGVLPDESPSSFPPLSDHGYPDRMRARVLENSVTYVEQRLPELWPALNRTGGAGVAPLLVGGVGGGAKRAAQDVRAALETQYYRANVDPSARYNLPMPGGISGTRLYPAARAPFQNVLVVGDWTLNGVNAGCAESAITSGMLAARELIGVPRDSVFTDYFMQAGEWEP